MPSKKLISLKTFNSEFLCNDIWFTDQNSKPLEIEDKINIASVIKQSVKYKNDTLLGSTLLDFCLLLKIWAKTSIKM